MESFLRPANKSDLGITFLWATDPLIRKNSFNQSTITKSDHEKWFNAKISSVSCFYYILLDNGRAVGSIRFDICNDIGTISYLIDSAYHGRGYGRDILDKGIMKIKANCKEVKILEGWVKNENTASIRIFEKLKFRKMYDDGLKSRFELQLT